MLFLFAMVVLSALFPTQGVARVRVCIAGGGPAGLLTAHTLLHRSDREYEVHLFDGLSDPRQLTAGPRAYSLGLNLRGQNAIKNLAEKYNDPFLYPLIEREGVYCDSFYVHLLGQKIIARKPQSQKLSSSSQAVVPPTLLIPRNRLSAAILIDIEQKYKPIGRFFTKFDVKVISADLKRKEVLLSDGRVFRYDLLVGADGLSSAVRESMVQQSTDLNPIQCDVVDLEGKYKVMLQDCPAALESDSIHLLDFGGVGRAGFSLFVIPALKNKVCALALWQGSQTPEALRSDTTLQRMRELFILNYPLFGIPSDDSLAQLQQQRPSQVKVVRCNRYHHVDGAAVLVGDAAHCTGGTLGQGANSALLDVQALDQAIDDAKGDLRRAMAIYSARQVPEGLALWKLLQLPPRNPVLSLLYRISQWVHGILNKLPFVSNGLISVPQKVQDLISKSDLPFTEIVRQVRNFLCCLVEF